MSPKPTSPLLVCTLLLGGAIVGGNQRTGDKVAGSLDAPEPAVIVEEVQFRHEDNLLAGNLYRPRLPGRRPAVALVFGSGTQDRSSGGVGSALGQHFAHKGFVCLTWDKPGVGKSTGNFNAQTLRNRAGEALAALQFLRERPEVRGDAVGLWGHSQGGMVVPLAASLSDKVSFVIQVSGWQGAAWRQDAVRVEAELRADGFPEADIKEAVAFAQMRMALIRGTGPFEELETAQARVKMRPWFGSVHWCDRTLFHAARLNVEYDTGPSWEKVRCPVLAIYGDEDTSSGPSKPLVAVIRTGLEKAQNADVVVHLFGGADHSLCVTKTGGPKEQAQRARDRKDQTEVDFVPGYLDAMTDWLGERFPIGP
jgi:pimeloyl-ACP methyl ester carboxylesterase